MSNPEEAKEYFKKFRIAILEDLFEDMRELRTFPIGSYKSFENDHEIIQLQRNIYHNLNEVFQDLDVPNSEFQTNEQILLSWQNFLNLLERYDKVIEDCYNSDNEPSFVLTKIDSNRKKMMTALKESIRLYGDDIPSRVDLIEYKERIKDDSHYNYCFLVVLFDTELQQLLNCFHKHTPISVDDGSRTLYYEVSINSDDAYPSIVACSNQMGLTSASTLATNIIRQFNPNYLFMTGICAGISGNIGDILIGDVFWDYGSGKIESDKSGQEVFKPYRNPEKINNDLFKKIILHSGITDLSKKIGSEYEKQYLFEGINLELDVKVGPFASGAAVVANSNVKSLIKQQEGKLIGFDMEAYGVIYAANNTLSKNATKCLIIKSISDFGDEAKGTNLKAQHQRYAAYTSSKFLVELLRNKIFD